MIINMIVIIIIIYVYNWNSIFFCMAMVSYIIF